MKFLFAILCLVVVSDEGLAQKCNADAVRQCLTELGGVVEKMVRIQEAGGKDVNNFCSTLNPEPKCVKDIPKMCKEDFSVISMFSLRAQLYMSEFCGENAKMYMDLAPCLSHSEVLLQSCPRKEPSSLEKYACEFVDFMLCMAKFSKESCKNGEAYGTALEKRMNIRKVDACSLEADVNSGAGYLANTFWIFAITVLSVVLMRNKLQ